MISNEVNGECPLKDTSHWEETWMPGVIKRCYQKLKSCAQIVAKIVSLHGYRVNTSC